MNLFKNNKSRNATVASCLLASGLIAGQASAGFVFATGFNADTAGREAGTLGDATVNGAFSFVDTTIGGVAARAIQMDDTAAGTYVGLANTGVTGTTYSVIFDLKTPAAFSSGFITLTGPEVGDQQMFIRGNGGVDIGDLNANNNSAPGTITNDVWHRIVITSLEGSGALYLDGVRVPIPGTGATPPAFTDVIGLFRDNDGDNQIGTQAANFALFDHALTGGQVNSLGGATAAIIDGLPNFTVGDTNGDDTVDLDDYIALRDNFGTGTDLASGDVDFDGDVDQLDFNIIRAEFPIHNGGASLASAIPEPTSLALIGLGGLAMLRRNK